MKKKILALVLSVLMVLSCCSAMAVFAEEVEIPANIKTDFEPIPLAERTDNAITDPYNWGNTGLPAGWGWAATDGAKNGGNYTISSSVATSQYEDDATAKQAAQGLLIPKDKFDTSIYSGGATLVFSASVLSHNVNNPKLTWGMYQNNKKSILPMEYPTRAEGFETSNTAWKRFGATVAIPEDCDVLGNTLFAFGFSKMDAPASGSYAVNISASSMYLAPEAASDIKVTADRTSISTFEEIKLDADILNQVNYTGNLLQNVTWYAMDADRNVLIPGITITEGENGTAVLTADSTVATGTYSVVAVSEANADLVKGITINVEKVQSFEDSVKVALSERTDNAILDATGWGQTYNGLTGFAETESQNTYTIAASGEVNTFAEDATAKHAAIGLQFPTSKFDTSIYKGGTSLVFSASVLSHNTNNPKLTWGIYQATHKSILPVEYSTRADGFETSSTAWKRFGATVAIPEDCDVLGNTIFSFGFSQDTRAVNKAVNINRSSMYLAPEVAADIKVTADKTSMFTFESIKLGAEVYNQIDLKGTVSQKVTWYAMDADRTAVVPGITIVDGVLTADNTVASGTYSIVAVSDANPDVVKGITITITNLSNDFVKVPLSKRTDNAITDKLNWTNAGTGAVSFTTTDGTTNGGNYTITKNDAASQWEENATAQWAAEGMQLSKGKFDTSIYKGGTTLVFSASLLPHHNNTKVTWGIYQATHKSILPMEYPTREEGMLLETNKWNTFGATVAIPEDCDVLGNTLFSFGFSKQDKLATGYHGVNINASSMYLAVEAASDIVVTADKTTVIAGKAETISLDADILNQVNYTGNLSQEITWYAMNEAKNTVIDEIQITEGADGTATVTIPATLAAGKYNVIAVSDADKALVRTTAITVEEVQITETTITSDGTNVTISAKDAIENAVLIFAKYDSNGRMLTADCTNDTITVSANGTTTVAIPAGFTTGNVKIMLWKDLTSFKPLAAAIE